MILCQEQHLTKISTLFQKFGTEGMANGVDEWGTGVLNTDFAPLQMFTQSISIYLSTYLLVYLIIRVHFIFSDSWCVSCPYSRPFFGPQLGPLLYQTATARWHGWPNGAGGVITFEQFQKNLKAAEVREYFQTLGVLAMDQVIIFQVWTKPLKSGAADHPGWSQGLDVWDA